MIPSFLPVGFQVLTALLGCTLVAQWQNTFFPSPKIKGLKPSTSTERDYGEKSASGVAHCQN